MDFAYYPRLRIGMNMSIRVSITVGTGTMTVTRDAAIPMLDSSPTRATELPKECSMKQYAYDIFQSRFILAGKEPKPLQSALRFYPLGTKSWLFRSCGDHNSWIMSASRQIERVVTIGLQLLAF